MNKGKKIGKGETALMRVRKHLHALLRDIAHAEEKTLLGVLQEAIEAFLDSRKGKS